MRNLVLITQLAFSLLGPIFLGLYLGLKVDKWLKTGSVFSIILLIFGVFSGFLNAYKLINSINSTKSKIEDKR